MALDYFYDAQLRKYIQQVIRAFSGFQVAFGKNPDGTVKFRVVPVLWASRDRQVGAIIGNNSENTVLSTPQMSVYMTSLEMLPERRQAPNYVDYRQVVEREVNKLDNKYMETRGLSYTVERLMPVPYLMTIQLDIWTTNENQKQQIMEQILVLFNPSIDLQSNTNALDWSALTTMELKNINWSSRGIPIGTSTELEISTLTFELPVWINPPSKVTRQRIIEQIITNITHLDKETEELNKDADIASIDWARGDLLTREITTPGNHCISVDGNIITLLNEYTGEFDSKGNPYSFVYLFDEYYDRYRPGISKIRLLTSEDLDDRDSDIIGTIQIDEAEPNKIYFSIDPTTLPQNTIPAINGVIDPHKSWVPVNGEPVDNPIPNPVIGTRYLIINHIVPNTRWGMLSAKPNDIIEYIGSGMWTLAFDSDTETKQIVLNKKTGQQLSWTGKEWIITIDGVYRPGMWRVSL